MKFKWPWNDHEAIPPLEDKYVDELIDAVHGLPEQKETPPLPKVRLKYAKLQVWFNTGCNMMYWTSTGPQEEDNDFFDWFVEQFIDPRVDTIAISYQSGKTYLPKASISHFSISLE